VSAPALPASPAAIGLSLALHAAAVAGTLALAWQEPARPLPMIPVSLVFAEPSAPTAAQKAGKAPPAAPEAASAPASEPTPAPEPVSKTPPEPAPPPPPAATAEAAPPAAPEAPDGPPARDEAALFPPPPPKPAPRPKEVATPAPAPAPAPVIVTRDFDPGKRPPGAVETGAAAPEAMEPEAATAILERDDFRPARHFLELNRRLSRFASRPHPTLPHRGGGLNQPNAPVFFLSLDRKGDRDTASDRKPSPSMGEGWVGVKMRARTAAARGVDSMQTQYALASARPDGVGSATPPLDTGLGPGDSALPTAFPGNPRPAYPFAARRKGVEGRVVLRVSVLASGGVAGIAVERTSGSRLLDRAALDAVRRWRFSPATRLGQPVASTVRVPITFRLDR